MKIDKEADGDVAAWLVLPEEREGFSWVSQVDLTVWCTGLRSMLAASMHSPQYFRQIGWSVGLRSFSSVVFWCTVAGVYCHPDWI